ncbi:hypothetical protein CVT25_000653 [Psilocybe cyanescens]|uniref:Uncharacterized protein n=1 Tax=Psilocybe cyanescens TaxID=93625 RepID=A0A409X3N5_PSICY|nr:hypothetical protein CVT25_000653 [Psilocybe cyanescens]
MRFLVPPIISSTTALSTSILELHTDPHGDREGKRTLLLIDSADKGEDSEHDLRTNAPSLTLVHSHNCEWSIPDVWQVCSAGDAYAWVVFLV